jgi:hypothetical protein
MYFPLIKKKIKLHCVTHVGLFSRYFRKQLKFKWLIFKFDLIFENSSILFLAVNPDKLIPGVLCFLLENTVSAAASKHSFIIFTPLKSF